jgi:hypothetical protein
MQNYSKNQTRISHCLYKRWSLIKYHCENPNSARYHLYGGRGIKLLSKWSQDFWLFAEWVETNLGLPQDYSDHLDRIDNNGDYRPGNLRWATAKENQNNTIRNRKITIGKETKTLQQWLDQTGLWHTTVHYRKQHGQTWAQALGFE